MGRWFSTICFVLSSSYSRKRTLWGIERVFQKKCHFIWCTFHLWKIAWKITRQLGLKEWETWIVWLHLNKILNLYMFTILQDFVIFNNRSNCVVQHANCIYCVFIAGVEFRRKSASRLARDSRKIHVGLRQVHLGLVMEMLSVNLIGSSV